MSTTSNGPASVRALVQRMGEAATNLLAALTPEQRAKAVIDFGHEAERTNWHYTPVDRAGLPLTEMDYTQKQLVHKLAATGLSWSGYVTASTIMGIENTLDAKEGWLDNHNVRDPLRYWVSLFGTPSDSEPWGWRFEGHHISLNYTIVKGEIVAPTPTFFGSNPAEAPLGRVATLRPLAGVEDLARDLVHALDQGQQSVAILAPHAPSDIILANRPYVKPGALPAPTIHWHQESYDAEMQAHFLQTQRERGLTDAQIELLRYSDEPRGIAVSALNRGQREIIQALLAEYISRMPDELAQIEHDQLQARGIDGIHFAWAGGVERHQPHYYRLQGPRFLVEYDNTQNDANHVHSVWRDPQNDFGADLLAHHYAHEH